MTGTRRPRRPWSLRRQLVFVLTAVLLAFSAALAVTSTLALRSQLMSRLDTQLEQAAERLSSPPRRAGGPAGLPPGEPGAGPFRPWLGQAAGTLVVTYSDGAVERAGYFSQGNAFQDLTAEQLAQLQAVPADGRPHNVHVHGLGPYRALATPERSAATPADPPVDPAQPVDPAPASPNPDGAGEPSIVAMSTADTEATVNRYVAVELALGAVGVLLAAGLGAWSVRRSLRPLNAVAAAASRVSELELDRGEVAAIPRVPAAQTDERTEVGQVGGALNRMLDNVETSLAARHASEQQVRRFVADASHELRTPLASIRGYAELVRRSPDVVPPATAHALDRIESESGRMSALVEDLLLLARLDAGRPLERAPVDLAALAIDALTDAHAAGPAHAWELDLPDGDGDPEDADGLPDLVVPGDEARLRQVFTNLLANARIHTPAGTRVRLGLAVTDSAAPPPTTGTGVVVTVSDDGPGIAPELRHTLFQRFIRGDSARNRTGGSTGLGLAIAQGIVTAHGGTIAVRSRTAADPRPATGDPADARPANGEPGIGEPTGAPATGTTFVVTLPQ